jgi:hypothetical protein
MGSMKNTLIAMSCLVIAGMVACTTSSPRRVPNNTTGTAGTSPQGAAGTTVLQGTAGSTQGTAGGQGTAGSTQGTAGGQGTAGSTQGTAGASGSGGGTAGTGGTGGDQGTAGASGSGGGTAGAGGTGGAGGGAGVCVPGTTTGAGGGTGNACANTMWTFTPNNICMNPPNASCGFCGGGATGLTGSCAPKNAIDGSTTTRYTSGEAQVGGENFVLAFAAPVSVTGIKLDSSGSISDVATSYLVEYSLDGTTFQTWCPPVAGMGDANTGINDIAFPARTTVKALRVTQTGTSAAAKWWSLQEVTVDGCQMP